ncbi:MAG: aldehyde dehydrogenase family protein, partial [Pseudomonadota bacterium]
QTCVCANRILVQARIHDAFVDRLAERMGALKVGAGLEDGTTIGPLITDAAVEKVEAHIADATAKGATIRLGGERHARGGRFFQPTLITGATADMRLCHEETFGPLAALFRFETEAEVVAAANASDYGLAAYVYTRDLGCGLRMAEALESGLLGLNAGILSTTVGPFGGVKQSGLGREGAKAGLEEFLETKFVCIGPS